MTAIVLDSTPLGLLTQKPNAARADECRDWAASKTSQGLRIVVPEVVDYELRRELLRSRRMDSIHRLDQLLSSPVVTYMPITTDAMRLAADLWARARQQGVPTADPHALDVDVILSAQVLSAGLKPADFVVATSNTVHLSRFVPAQTWFTI
jgi:predicted nucleic acid-binding protein